MVFCKMPKLGYFVRKIVTADNQKLPNLVTLRWTQVDKDFCWTKWNISANVRSAIQIDQTLCVFFKKSIKRIGTVHLQFGKVRL